MSICVNFDKEFWHTMLERLNWFWRKYVAPEMLTLSLKERQKILFWKWYDFPWKRKHSYSKWTCTKWKIWWLWINQRGVCEVASVFVLLKSMCSFASQKCPSISRIALLFSRSTLFFPGITLLFSRSVLLCSKSAFLFLKNSILFLRFALWFSRTAFYLFVQVFFQLCLFSFLAAYDSDQLMMPCW